MAEKGKKSGRISIVLIIFLSLVLVGSLAGNYFVYNNFNNKKKALKNFNEEYDKVKKEYDDKLQEVKELEEDAKKYDDLDKQISEETKKYYATIKKLEDKILAKESDKKIAYLTFDDGPYYNTYNVLDILDKYDVKATFFTQSGNGQNCYDNKNANCYDLYKEYVKRGHTIANHTYTHAIFKGLYNSTAVFMDAVDKQHEHIKEYSGGYVPNIMRFPGGSATAGRLKDPIVEELRKRGYGWVDWSAQDGDGGNLTSTDQAWANFKSSINDNIEVVLFHDYDRRTTAIRPNVIEYLQEKGYQLFPLFYESNMINK